MEHGLWGNRTLRCEGRRATGDDIDGRVCSDDPDDGTGHPEPSDRIVQLVVQVLINAARTAADSCD